jgi:SAM-dependent methyltransferase
VAAIEAQWSAWDGLPGQYPSAVPTSQEIFWSLHYLRHNRRRHAHLASLGLGLADRTVLEVGAGIGDHTRFLLDQGCHVISSEAQEENLAVLRDRYPELDVRQIDLNNPPTDAPSVDVVYCYGTLYHLDQPARAIGWMGSCTRELLLLETCVASGEGIELYPFADSPGPEYAVDGHGCRPTRSWVREELSRSFPHVYCTLTQPWHEEFPLDWHAVELENDPLIRAVFVASRAPLDHPALTETIPARQIRH